MSTFFLRSVVVMGSTLLAFAAVLAAQDANADERAKKIHGQFIKAIEAKDLDALMKLAGVPWLGFGKEVIQDEEELRKKFKHVLAGFKGFRPKKEEAEEVMSYAKFRAKYPLKKELVKQLDDLKLLQEDRVVIGPLLGVVLIRIREGKAKIVGVLGD